MILQNANKFPCILRALRVNKPLGKKAGWSYSAKWLMAGRTLGVHPICAEMSGGSTFLSEKLATRTYSLQLAKRLHQLEMKQKHRQIKMQFPISHIAAILVA